MIETTRIAPVNSQFVIVDPKKKGIEVPEYQEAVPYVATSSCILFYSYPEPDGETEISLGYAKEIDPRIAPVFEGYLLTPSRILAIETVYGDTVLQIPTSDERTKLRIWSDAIKWPTKIWVGVE